MLRIRVSFLDVETAREKIALATGKEVLVEDPRFLNVLTIVGGSKKDVEELWANGFKEVEIWEEDEDTHTQGGST